jgi:hypothetical protein
VNPQGHGTSRVEFLDGTSGDFDLVVGADGAWSRVRRAVSPAEPAYSGVTFVETWLEETRHREVARLVGNGTMIAKVPGTGLFAQRNSGGHIRIYLALRTRADWSAAAGLDLEDEAAARAYLLSLLDGWHESLRDFIRHSDSGFVNRPLFVLPVPHMWEHAPGVTLLGDAAHLMPPLGVGAQSRDARRRGTRHRPRRGVQRGRRGARLRTRDAAAFGRDREGVRGGTRPPAARGLSAGPGWDRNTPETGCAALLTGADDQLVRHPPPNGTAFAARPGAPADGARLVVTAGGGLTLSRAPEGGLEVVVELGSRPHQMWCAREGRGQRGVAWISRRRRGGGASLG